MSAIVKRIAAAALMLAAATAAADARPVLVTADLNVRSGPGTENQSIGVIPGGSTAEVGRCFEGWCEIAWRGLVGFSSRAYLDGFGPPRVYAPPPPPPGFYGPRRYYDGPYGPYRPYYRYRPYRYYDW